MDCQVRLIRTPFSPETVISPIESRQGIVYVDHRGFGIHVVGSSCAMPGGVGTGLRGGETDQGPAGTREVFAHDPLGTAGAGISILN